MASQQSETAAETGRRSEMLRLRAEGLTLRKIAAIYGCSPERVRQVVGGIRRTTKWRDEWDDELVKDWNNGVSLSEFARRFGLGPFGSLSVKTRAIELGLMKETP